MSGFVRVSGYNQADLDNAYQNGYNNGIIFADNRNNPNSVSYITGYSDGAAFVVANSIMVMTKYNGGETEGIINAQWEDSIDIHIRNYTTNTLKYFIHGDMRGSAVIKTLDNVDLGALQEGKIGLFPPNGDLYFYQEPGSSSNGNGNLFIVILGNYSTYTNEIYWNQGLLKSSGTAEFR